MLIYRVLRFRQWAWNAAKTGYRQPFRRAANGVSPRFLPIVVSVSESQAQFYGKFETPVGLVHNSAVERASHESRKCPCTLPDHNSPATIASGKDAASARVPLGHDRAPWVRDLAISLSLANLCFLNLWSKLQSNYFDYFRNAPADPKAALSRLGPSLLAFCF